MSFLKSLRSYDLGLLSTPEDAIEARPDTARIFRDAEDGVLKVRNPDGSTVPLGSGEGGSATVTMRAHPDLTADDAGKNATIVIEEIEPDPEDMYVKVYSQSEPTTGTPGQWTITFADISEKNNYGATLHFIANPTEGDTVKIKEQCFLRNELTFSFKAVPVDPDFDVLIGADADETAENLYTKINAWLAANKAEYIYSAIYIPATARVQIALAPALLAIRDNTDDALNMITITVASAAITLPSIHPRPPANITWTKQDGAITPWHGTWNHAGAPNGEYPLTAEEEAENFETLLNATTEFTDLFTVTRDGAELTIEEIEPGVIDDVGSSLTGFTANCATVDVVEPPVLSSPESSLNQWFGIIQSVNVEDGTCVVSFPRVAQFTLHEDAEVNFSTLQSGIIVAHDGGTVRNVQTFRDLSGLVGLAVNQASGGEQVTVVIDGSFLLMMMLISDGE